MHCVRSGKTLPSNAGVGGPARRQSMSQVQPCMGDAMRAAMRNDRLSAQQLLHIPHATRVASCRGGRALRALLTRVCCLQK
eukprot:364339-Chlamydomonas_euryale.AAC.10